MLVGLSRRANGKFHAVPSREDDKRPLGHGHYTFRPALCGASVCPRPWKWSRIRPNLCRACVKQIERCRHLDVSRPTLERATYRCNICGTDL